MSITRVTARQLNVFTVKGDLLGFTGTANVVVPVGSDGTALTADSTASGGVSYQPQNGGYKNRIINGAMLWNQRQSGSYVSPATSAYTIDRWQWRATTTGTVTISQDTSVPTASTTVPSFPFSLKVTVTATDTSIAATDFATVGQNLEGYTLLPLKDRTMVLSFWVRASITGTYGVSFQNSGQDPSYVATYSVNVANTWEKKSIVLTHNSSGSWNYNNALGMRLAFCLMTGTTYQGTAGAWTSGTLRSTSAQVNVLGTSSATWYLTGVQLELGSVATEFEQRMVAEELRLCQRYYQTTYPPNVEWPGQVNSLGPILVPKANAGTAALTAGGAGTCTFCGFKVDMRSDPGSSIIYDYDGTANACRVYPADQKRIGSTLFAMKSTGSSQAIFFDASSTTVVPVSATISAHVACDAEL